MHIRSAFAIGLVIGLFSISANSQNDSSSAPGLRHHRGHLLKRADANGDGQISRDEWKRRPRAFARLDTNHDGSISRTELQEAARNRGERRRKALERIDKNNDGQISRDEWPRGSEIFARLDQNHDGLLTREELAAGRHRRQR
jgi:hypothetical protein